MSVEVRLTGQNTIDISKNNIKSISNLNQGYSTGTGIDVDIFRNDIDSSLLD